MEENIAILMADLSGYTALTEVHGAVSAADLIDKYVEIAESCLVGGSRLHERVGDEIMIVSNSPDELLATAMSINNKTSTEEHFLQVHGGLHYGKVLKRSNSYFGSAINLTARIAASANPGTIRCSAEYKHALRSHNQHRILSKGFQHFKNINEESEIFEIKGFRSDAAYLDPVCRMLIQDVGNAIPHPSEEEKYFCSVVCLNIYRANNGNN